MKLYELTEMYSDLFNQFDAINEWEPDTNAYGMPIDDDGNIIANVDAYRNKMLTASIAIYYKQLLAEAKMLKSEKAAIAKRQSQKEKQAESLKTYLFKSMQALGRQKIDMPKAVMSLKKNAPSLVIDDEISFVEWAEEHNLDHLLKYSMPEVKKNDVKALCKKGEEIPFIHMEAKQSLSIK